MSSRDEIIESIVEIVRDCSYEGCNVASAEMQAEKIADKLQEVVVANAPSPTAQGIESIRDILENILYWDTCPEEYKERIENILKGNKAWNTRHTNECVADADKTSKEAIKGALVEIKKSIFELNKCTDYSEMYYVHEKAMSKIQKILKESK